MKIALICAFFLCWLLIWIWGGGAVKPIEYFLYTSFCVSSLATYFDAFRRIKSALAINKFNFLWGTQMNKIWV